MAFPSPVQVFATPYFHIEMIPDVAGVEMVRQFN